MAIGIKIMVRMVFDWKNKALKAMANVSDRYKTQKGVWAPNPRASKAAFTEIEGRSVDLNPAPRV